MEKWKLVNFCEFDQNQTDLYCKIHEVDESLNLGDITKVDEKALPDCDLITGGSPCQSFSTAGKQEGSRWDCLDCGYSYNPIEAHYTQRDKCPKCGSKNIKMTTSSLLVEYLRILREKRPKFAIYENVKALVTEKFKPTFDLFVKELEEYGYNVYYKVLNATDYGIPQERERVYGVIIRKDVDNGKFKFPKPVPLTKDLSEFIDFREKDDLTFNFARRYKEIKGEDKTYENFINYIDSLPIRKGIGSMQMGLYNFNEMDTITTIHGTTGTITCRNPQNYNKKFWYNNKLYRPSPRMCFRLMGFSDEDFDKVENYEKGDTYLWNAAGNSIVCTVLYHIYKSLYNVMPYLFDNLRVTSLFSGIGAFEKALDMLYEDINKNNGEENKNG